MSGKTLEQRRTALLARVKRRRQEVEHYLDNLLYTRCREVLRVVRGIDSANALAGAPVSSKDADAKHTGWSVVQRHLDEYEYTKTSEFIDDMRSIVNRCYEDHGRDSAISKVARDVELAMEDQFVRTLAVPPADFQQISALARRAPKSTKLAIVEMIAFYTDKRQPLAADAQRVRFSPSELRNATKFRVLQLLQSASRQSAHRERPPPSSAPPRKTPVAPVTLQSRPEPPRPALSKTLLSGPDSLNFHDEEPPRKWTAPTASSSTAAVQLERVPQNDGKETLAAAVISPVLMQDEEEDDLSGDSDAGVGDAS